LKAHERRAGVSRVVEAFLRYVEVLYRCLPQPAQRRRMVWLAGFVAHDVAEIGVRRTEGESFSGLAGFRRS
jgi:hypothetical protein